MDSECRDRPDEGRVEFPVCQMRSRAHTRPSTVAIVGRSSALRAIEIPLWDELFRLMKVFGIVVCGPGILIPNMAWSAFRSRSVIRNGKHANHEKCSTSWNNGCVPLNVSNALPRQADRDHCPIAKDFFDERGDVRHFLFNQAFTPRVIIRVNLHDLLVCLVLDALAIVTPSEVGQGHHQIAWNRIQASRDHG